MKVTGRGLGRARGGGQLETLVAFFPIANIPIVVPRPLSPSSTSLKLSRAILTAFSRVETAILQRNARLSVLQLLELDPILL